MALGRLQWRLVRSLVLYGSLLAAAAAIVGYIHIPAIDMPPRRLIAANAALYVPMGCIFTLIFLLPMARWIGGRAEESRVLPLWLFIGIVFGIFTVFLIGASAPFAVAIQSNILHFRSLGRLLDDIIDAFFRMPLSAFTFGVLSLYVGLILGPIYGIGAWIIDMLNRADYPHSYADPWIEAIGDGLPAAKRLTSSASSHLAFIGPWAVAAIVGGAFLLFAAYGPVEFLAKFRVG